MDRLTHRASTDRLKSKEHGENPTPTFYKVTSSFGLVSIFTMIFVCSAMFGVFQAFQITLKIQAVIIGLVTIVAIVQMLATESQARLAAVGSGWFAAGGFIAYQATYLDVFMGIFASLCLILCAGSLLGYCAGTIVAGIFLISDYVQVILHNIFDNPGHLGN